VAGGGVAEAATAPAGPGTERGHIQRKLERLREVYLDGDLDAAAYRQRNAALTAELAALPAEDAPGPDVGERLAYYLADIAVAWQVSTPEVRNKLARQVSSAV
jgi:hypothetical protein